MSFRRHSFWIMPVLSGLLILLLWWVAGLWIEGRALAGGAELWEARGARRLLLPFPTEIWGALRQHQLLILRGTWNTFVAAVIGFATAAGVGFLIALCLAASIHLKQALYPWVLALQMTPVVILAPIFAIWLGPGMVSIVAVTFLIGFFPVVANTTMGLVSTDRGLLDLFAICRASRAQEFLYLRIPYALPYFFTGARIAGTLAPIGAITGDVFVGSGVAGGAGLGFLTLAFRANANTPAVFATAAVACLLGFGFVGCSYLLHRWALRHWHPSVVRKEI